MKNEANNFRNKLLVELENLEIKFSIKTKLKEKISTTENINDLYECFNTMERIEICMTRIYELVDVIYDKLISITPLELQDLIKVCKCITKSTISNSALFYDYDINKLIPIIESNAYKEMELIRLWKAAI